MNKKIELTWEADGEIDSYTIYRSFSSIDIDNLPEPLITGLGVRKYTDIFEDTSVVYYIIASVRGNEQKLSEEYMIEFDYI